jgi:hypothetical protein
MYHPRPADRPQAPGPPGRLGAGRVRQPHAGRPTRTLCQQGRADPAARSLSRGPAAQARCSARRDRARPPRAAGTFTTVHEAFSAAARKALGDTARTGALIEVLLLHRHLAHADVLAGVTAAFTIGSVNAGVVAVEACKGAAVRGSAEPDDVVAPPKRERVPAAHQRITVLRRPLESAPAYRGQLRLTVPAGQALDGFACWC